MRFAPAIALLFTAPALAEHSLLPDQAELLDLARHYALNYAASLPDFLCNQLVQRSEDPRGDGRWRPLDTLNIKVSYFDHKEEYKLIEVDGRPTVVDYQFMGGTISTGEFGTRLLAVFAKPSKALFGWKGWAHVRHRKVAVFTYQIARENSGNVVQLGPVSTGPNAIVIAYHGEVAVDPETHAVLRVSLTGDLPPRFPITACHSWVEYDYREVAGHEYLLPVESQTGLSAGRYRSSNRIVFHEYRKFQTDATITFQ